MFKDELRKVVDSTDGGLASILMDFEGIPVETYAKKEAPFDIETIGAEVSVVVKAIQRASESLEAGAAKEVALKSDKLVTLIRVLNDGYFVVLAMQPDGNLGQGRFRLRLAAPALVQELS